MGVLWLAFGGVVYWYAGIDPIVTAIRHLLAPHSAQSVLSYLNTSGVSFTLGVIVIGIIIYFVRNVQNRMKGVDLSLLYKTIPPD
jgi:predicted PurR-regulated permease PerM